MDKTDWDECYRNYEEEKDIARSKYFSCPVKFLQLIYNDLLSIRSELKQRVDHDHLSTITAFILKKYGYNWESPFRNMTISQCVLIDLLGEP